MTLAQAVRSAYGYMDEPLTWDIWHKMSHDDRVEMAALFMGEEKAKELL